MTHCSKEQREAIVNQYANSGLSLRPFADIHGISKSSLYTWSRKLDIKTTQGMKKNTLSAEQRLNMKKVIVPIFVLFIFMSQNSMANNREYSVFCELVTAAMILRSETKSRHDYIVNHLDERVGSKNIKDAYDVVFQVAPNKRYSVFKESIEEEIGSEWECSGLKAYFGQYVK